MATLAEIKAKADELQVALDAEQVEIAAAIAALNVVIADLQALLVAGGTEAERQVILDQLNTIKADLEATVTP